MALIFCTLQVLDECHAIKDSKVVSHDKDYKDLPISNRYAAHRMYSYPRLLINCFAPLSLSHH